MNRIVCGAMIAAVSVEMVASVHGHATVVPNVHVPYQPSGPLMVVVSAEPISSTASFSGPMPSAASSAELWEWLARSGLDLRGGR